MMRMRCVHLETGEPREAAHSRPRERALYEVEMDDDVVVMANRSQKNEKRVGEVGKDFCHRDKIIVAHEHLTSWKS